jgi:hypothetical protein
MKRLTIILAGFALFATAAQAQTATDTKKIEECLTKADESDASGTACVGIVADPCINAARGKNDDDKNWKKCAAQELPVWTALMKKAIADIKGGGTAEITKAANASQDAWTKSTATLCPVFDKIEPGIVPGGANYCRLQATGQRVVMLRKLAVAVNEH